MIGSHHADPKHLWEATLAHLQVQLSRRDFNTWLKDTHLVAYEDGAFIIGVPNAFAKEWLSNRLHPVIKRTLETVANRSTEIHYIVDPRPLASAVDEPMPLAEPEVNVAPVEETVLNPKYTFDRFIVGPNNRMAHAAAMAVAERPGHAYNPLFIYGGVGLGKTHLLHAIGHMARAQGYRVLYVSSETFTNDLINAIRTQTTDEFRARYRHVDVLLIDDIQFIAGKESTQEEFFHTFNSLHAANKQICLTSDRPPREIATLEERLRSRFQGGIIVDIRTPDFEMRLAILRSHAEEAGVFVPDDVLSYVAERVQSNVRELVGAFNRLLAHAVLIKEPLTLSLAREILEDMVPVKRQLTPEALIRAVAQYYHISVEDLRSKSRRRTIAHPRQVAMYLLREETGLSFPQIGELLGGRDHTTVMHGYERVAQELAHQPQLEREIKEIRTLAERGGVPVYS